MKKLVPVFLIVLALLGVGVLWGIRINNRMVQEDEHVTKAWSQVENVYKRRADLIPQLVSTVQGAADFERSTFTEVTELRAQAGAVKVSDLSEENIAAFQKAQDRLSSSLSRAINVTMENYPQLAATQNFRDLQTQLEGTENRIAVERGKFNEAVQRYNTMIRKFPNSVVASMAGFEKKGYFTAPEGAEEPVAVNFDFE